MYNCVKDSRNNKTCNGYKINHLQLKVDVGLKICVYETKLLTFKSNKYLMKQVKHIDIIRLFTHMHPKKFVNGGFY